ncbi:MAG TPA: class I SAM-dependent methyltransferase [Thermoanaerobaculia bacterium]|nr:class I SAM-dependent methyltransferase [Thermoanaerobaculia bacterium]
MTWYREWFGEEYLDLYAHRGEEEARAHVAFFRAQFGRIEGEILDLACGRGRHIREFRAAGYRITGCDLSWVLLRHGLAELGPMPLVGADMRRLPFRDGSFGGLVNFFTSFGYFEEEEENLRTVKEMARVMTKAAPWVFDYLNVTRELGRLVEREERPTEGGKVLIERWFDITSRTFNKRITIGERHFLERVKGYDLDEITAIFAAGGMAIRRAFGDFDGAPYTLDSPRLILVGTRGR